MTTDDNRPMSKLYSVRDVAEYLNVSTETVRRWVRRGELPAIKLPGGTLRFDEKELGPWLRERGMRS